MNTTPLRITQAPQACMSGGTAPGYFALEQHCQHDGSLLAGGPLDAPDCLPIGGAWNYEVRGVQLSYGSVLRQGALA